MNPHFRLKKIPHPQTLAQILTQARKKRGYSLSEIEKKTKIRAKYLQALEEGRYGELPADVYTKGFLKIYCQVLGLPLSKILSLYSRERGIQKSIKKTEEPQLPRYLAKPKVIITPRTLIIGGGGLAFLLILGYIWYQFSSLTGSPNLKIEYPPDNLRVSEDTLTIEGKTDPGTEVYIDGQKIIGLNPDGSFKSMYSLQPGLNTIEIVAKNKMGSSTKVLRRILAELPTVVVEKPPEIPQKTPSAERLELTLKIGPNHAWLQIEVDGKMIYQGIMTSKTRRTFEGKESIILTTGNAGSTSLIFNGKDLGKLGQEGEVRRGIKFDKNTKIE